MKNIPAKIQGGLKTHGKFFKKSGKDKPLVSIVTVCKNSERFLEDTIKSVINQSYDNIEYIVIDGESKDKTLDIIKRYESNIAYWVSEPDEGIYDAMNKGVSIAAGEWVGIINSDDWYHPNAVEWLILYSRNNPDIDVFYGDLLYPKPESGYLRKENWLKDGKEIRRSGTHENMLDYWRLTHPSCFVRKSNYLKYHFNQSFKLSADYDFLLSLYSANKKFFHIPKPMVYFRPIGKSSKFSYRSVFEHFLIRKKYNIYKALKYLFLETIDYLKEFCYLCKQYLER